MARAADEVPVGAEAAGGAGDRALVGVAVDLQHPAECRSGFRRRAARTASPSLSSSSAPCRADLVGAGGEQHLRLEDETVADDADVGAVAEDLAEAPEEVGAVARQLLDALGERDVEAPAEVGDLGLALLVLRPRRRRAPFRCAAIWRRSAAICWLSSSTCDSARWLTCFSASSSLVSAATWLPADCDAVDSASSRPCSRSRSLSAAARLACRRGEVVGDLALATPSPAPASRSVRRSGR